MQIETGSLAQRRTVSSYDWIAYFEKNAARHERDSSDQCKLTDEEATADSLGADFSAR